MTEPSQRPAPPSAILESVLYADDLEAAEIFYRDVLGLTVYARKAGRQVFFKLEDQMLLIFRPAATRIPPAAGGLPVPPHGASGEGHVCFAANASEIERWRLHLPRHGIPIEADFEWPAGGRSIYVRDPAGNSVEFAEARLWGF